MRRQIDHTSIEGFYFTMYSSIRSSSFRRAVQAGRLAVLALVFVAGDAFAHAHLVRAEPAAQSVAAQPPAMLDLYFTEGVEPAFSRAELYRVGDDGATTRIETGKPAVDPADGKHLSESVQGALAPGRYTVKWQALATDGHKTQGQYDFTVK